MADPTVQRMRSSTEIEATISMFEEIADEEGWSPSNGLRAWKEQSVYFGLLLDPECDRLVGGLQLVHNPFGAELPTYGVWPELRDNREISTALALAHINVMAVAKEYRGKSGGLFWELAIEMWRYCVENGIQEILLESTPRTLRCYCRFGWPIQVIGDLREHWGEPCYPCRLSVREVAGALAEKALRCESYRQLFTSALRPLPAPLFLK